ncbi:unnamed protein product [Symbiodinium natans]|uniref:PPPDE domain-containing protein n=1 Tax=Symbiodinium natans TaxID=878477 RepID=A0A812SGI7_9DINO|nr:unnamed protein product [Symbiodinium natans]
MGNVNFLSSCSDRRRWSASNSLSSVSSSCKRAQLNADVIDSHDISGLGNVQITSVLKISTRLEAFRSDGADGHQLSWTERTVLGAWHDELYFVYLSCGKLRACRLSWTQDGLEKQGLVTSGSFESLQTYLAKHGGHCGGNFYECVAEVKMEQVVKALKAMAAMAGCQTYDVASFNCQHFCERLLRSLPVVENEQLAVHPLPGQERHPEDASEDQPGTAAENATAEAANSPMPARLSVPPQAGQERHPEDASEDQPGTAAQNATAEAANSPIGMEESWKTVSSHNIQDPQEDGAAEEPASEQAHPNAQVTNPQDEDDYHFVESGGQSSQPGRK